MQRLCHVRVVLAQLLRRGRKSLYTAALGAALHGRAGSRFARPRWEPVCTAARPRPRACPAEAGVPAGSARRGGGRGAHVLLYGEGLLEAALGLRGAPRRRDCQRKVVEPERHLLLRARGVALRRGAGGCFALARRGKGSACSTISRRVPGLPRGRGCRGGTVPSPARRRSILSARSAHAAMLVQSSLCL